MGGADVACDALPVSKGASQTSSLDSPCKRWWFLEQAGWGHQAREEQNEEKKHILRAVGEWAHMGMSAACGILRSS